MTFSPGMKVGSYEILGPLGAGGMGEVYRARDSRLKREVAIKVLPDEFSRNEERVARFQREAEVLASLNHPHIAAIHHIEEFEGSRFLVLELMEGETLADRIARGPIPPDEVLEIAKQIAGALEAAHDKGIIHRDLKPANIKMTPGGSIKVLDFGLAKALSDDASGPSLSHSPTISVATNAGVILGTAAYMSPEQARGMNVDRRTDLFAFGAVLYEMLTGRPAFQGETVSDIIASVLKVEPDWTRMPSNMPDAVRRLLRRCLQKDRNHRLDSAAAARIELEEAQADPEPQQQRVRPSSRGARLAWILVSALSLVVVALVIPAFRYFGVDPNQPEIRTEIVTPATNDPLSFALSPDGRQIVFVGSGDGPSRLWLRPLAAATAQPLPGTEGATYPFWSPDGRSVGFFAESKLKRLDIGGGRPQNLANAATGGQGGTWNADGVILFAPSNTGPLFRIASSGGDPVAVTRLEGQASHRFPQFFADGHHFLFFAQGTSPEVRGIYLGSLDSEEPKRLTQADAAGIYLPSGWLLFVQNGALRAQHLDLQRKELVGDAVTVADPVTVDTIANRGAFSLSDTGLIAYRTGGVLSRRQLTWFDHSGKMLGVLVGPDAELNAPSISPDGRRVAVGRTVQDNRDIWILDGTRTIRFTFYAGLDLFPIWSRDGNRIFFDSNRKGMRNIYAKQASGAGNETLLVESAQDKTTTDSSADGRFLLFHSNDPQTARDLWVLPLQGDRKPWVLLKTNFDERHGQSSPDGHWIAYMSDESGRQEIYVRPFAEPNGSGAASGSQWQISTAGGIFPRWRSDGKELYYIAPDGKLMAAPISVVNGSVEPGTPVALFATRIYGGGADNNQGRQYDVSRDGRFLINTVLDDASFSPITLLQNWKPRN